MSLRWLGCAIQLWIQCRIVIHLKLAIEFESPAAGEYIGPQLGEAAGEVEPLLCEDPETLAVAVAMGLGGVAAFGLLRGVEDFEGEDGKPVNDEAGGLGVERGPGGLIACDRKQGKVELLDEIVALLVEDIDGALDAGNPVVASGWIAGRIFFVPEVEVGSMLGEKELFERCVRSGGRVL